MSNVIIAKIQVPVATNEVEAEALVYNKDRSIEFFYPIDAVVKRNMKGEPKKFFQVYVDLSKKIMIIQKELEDQGW